ncbi:MAG: TerB family tellurite resistance protein, partial [Dolichospermum sp.]
YSDGDIAIEEARLLTQLTELSKSSSANQAAHTTLLKQIQKLYRRCVDVQN